MSSRTQLLALAVLATVFAAPVSAKSVGLADGKASYQIIRQDSTLSATPEAPAVVKDGDRIAAGEAPVRVQTMNGRTVLMSERSALSFPDEGTVRLHSGEAAVSLPAGANSTIAFENLSIAPLPAEGAQTSPATTLAVKSTGPDEIEVLSMNEPVTVTDSEGVQVAVVGENEVMRFLRNPMGQWEPNLTPLAQDPTVPPDDTTNQKKKIFGVPLTTPVIVGAVVVGTGAVTIGGIEAYQSYQDSKEEDNKNDDTRGEPEESPIFPGGPGGGGPGV